MAAEELREEYRQARKKALRLLEHMDRTERGLTERLIRGGFSADAASDAVSWVKELGYVNDTRYAENYISARIHGRSRQKIFQELYRKGVDRTSAAAAWEEISFLEQPDEREMIRTETLKKYDQGTELSEKEMRRLLGRFARRGFRAEDISAVLDELDITTVFH